MGIAIANLGRALLFSLLLIACLVIFSFVLNTFEHGVAPALSAIVRGWLFFAILYPVLTLIVWFALLVIGVGVRSPAKSHDRQ